MLSSRPVSSHLPPIWRRHPLGDPKPHSGVALPGVLERPLVRTMRGRVGIDRLYWRDAPPPPLKPGQIETAPSAVGARSHLHAARTRTGANAWVRVVSSGAPLAETFAVDHRIARAHATSVGLRVPGVLAVDVGRVWLDRLPWGQDPVPRADIVDRFVESAIVTPLVDGTVVALGLPHATGDGHVVVEDCGVLARLEPDQSALVGRLLRALADLDPHAAAAAVHLLTGVPEELLLETAQRACAVLRVNWTPGDVGLSVHQLATRATHLGSRSAPFLLFADELLHRLDLRHAHPLGTEALADPPAVRRLLVMAEHCP
jgi:hypothetical protein